MFISSVGLRWWVGMQDRDVKNCRAASVKFLYGETNSEDDRARLAAEDEWRAGRDLIWTPRKSPQGYYFPLLVYYNQHFISADYEELFNITTGPHAPPFISSPRPDSHILHNKCVLFFPPSISYSTLSKTPAVNSLLLVVKNCTARSLFFLSILARARCTPHVRGQHIFYYNNSFKSYNSISRRV